ncbi:hypothetical protein B0T26DRAFT_733709 [Lasiosphaeria miniovina]|uniref:Secreted protein n=1 Tax=Lasiosphaeria miniovina TaxID=1954250 RepID=A0AA40DJV3_9PEZI|nr:uncharacterized protein B0T26DRAFT_733709 [Lasiosphaeria miniovina]KAK0704031.1 hypothetical protein B0T26DRAFT_733709 [Lasiosphaeria miniovina]
MESLLNLLNLLLYVVLLLGLRDVGIMSHDATDFALNCLRHVGVLDSRPEQQVAARLNVKIGDTVLQLLNH